MQKKYLDANRLLLDSFSLASQVHSAGYQPDFLLGVWRGGTPVAIAVHEYFEYQGLSLQHAVLKTSLYQGIDQQKAQAQIFGLDCVVDDLKAAHRILIVDDVFDTGRSMATLVDDIRKRIGAVGAENKNAAEIKVACAYYKPARNLTTLTPDFYCHTSEQWLVFPHELVGLTHAELLEAKGDELANIVQVHGAP